MKKSHICNAESGRFLATTALKEFWPSNSERTLFLGAWARHTGLNSRSDDYGDCVVPFYWSNTSKTRGAILYCEKVLTMLLPFLAERINAYNGTGYSLDYYRILLGTWPLHFVHQLYDKYIHIGLAVEMCPDLHTYILDRQQYYLPLDYDDYVSLMVSGKDDRFHLQVYSELIRYFDIGVEVRHLSASIPQQNVYRHVRAKGFKRRLKNVFHRSLGEFGRQPKSVFLSDCGISSWDKVMLFAKSGGKISFEDFDYDLSVSVQPDYAYRNECVENSGADQFERILFGSVMRFLPLVYLEGLMGISREVMSHNVGSNMKVIVSSQLSSCLPRSVYMAHNCDELVICSIQHGGGYGIDELNPSEMHERAIADWFFSSGWTDLDGVRPLENPKFKKATVKYWKNRDILFAVNDLPRYVYRLHFVPMSSSFVNYYLEDATAFLLALESRQEVCVRVHPLGDVYGNSVSERFVDKVGRLRFDLSGRPYRVAMRKSRMYVSNYFNTSFMEALANGLPSIVFINDKIFSFSSKVKPHIDALRRVGVFFDDPVSASKFVDAVYDDVYAWWSSLDVQLAISDFLNQFASCSTDWLDDWALAFDEVSNEGSPPKLMD